MSSTVSDRPLRRIVAELAMVAPEDIDAILAELEDRPRAEVKALLAAYYGHALGEAEPERRPSQAQISVLGLSVWLAGRVRGDVFGDHDYAMTPHAEKVLRECAADLPPEARPPRASWAEQLIEAFDGLRARSLGLISGRFGQ